MTINRFVILSKFVRVDLEPYLSCKNRQNHKQLNIYETYLSHCNTSIGFPLLNSSIYIWPEVTVCLVTKHRAVIDDNTYQLNMTLNSKVLRNPTRYRPIFEINPHMERAKRSFLLCPIPLSCLVMNKICLTQINPRRRGFKSPHEVLFVS